MSRSINHAYRIARRYAEGGAGPVGSPDEEQIGDSGIPLGPQPGMHVGRVLQMAPLSPDNPTEVRAPAMAMPGRAPPAEPTTAATMPGAGWDREALAQQVAGQLVERYGDNHQAISERMLTLDPQDHNDVLGHLPPSVRSGVIDHRLNEANRLVNGQQEQPPEPPRQPGASRSGYVSPYGIYGQSQMSDTEYESLQHPEQLSQFEGENTIRKEPTGGHPFSSMDMNSFDNYRKFIKPRLGSIYDFGKNFFAGYDTKGIEVNDGRKYGYGPGTINFEGSIRDKGKKLVGDFSSSIIPETNSAHLGLIHIEPEYRGTAGPKLLRNQIDAYRNLGLQHVDLLAAGDDMNFHTAHYGGSYAWAKYGFTPSQHYWDKIRGDYLDLLNSGEIAPVNPEHAQVARNLINDSDPRSIWTLSDMKSPTADGRPYGKTLLLTQSWGGQLTFNDPRAMRRFDAYIARPKKPTQ